MPTPPRNKEDFFQAFLRTLRWKAISASKAPPNSALSVPLPSHPTPHAGCTFLGNMGGWIGTENNGCENCKRGPTASPTGDDVLAEDCIWMETGKPILQQATQFAQETLWGKNGFGFLLGT